MHSAILPYMVILLESVSEMSACNTHEYRMNWKSKVYPIAKH